MDLNSLNDAINNFSDKDKEKLIHAVQENQAKLEIQGMISSLLDNHCFDQCIKSTKSLTGSEKDCLSNCASRFLDKCSSCRSCISINRFVHRMTDLDIKITGKAFRNLKLPTIPVEILILIVQKLDFDDAVALNTLLKHFPKRFVLQYHNFNFGYKWYGSSMRYKLLEYCQTPNDFKALVYNQKVQERVPGWGLVELVMETRDLECVKMVLKLEKITHQDCIEALKFARRLLFNDAISYLLSHFKSSDKRNNDFSRASKDGDVESIKLLLSDKTFSPYTVDMDYCCPLVTAARKGSEEIFKILWNDPRVYSLGDYNEALRSSCLHGHANIVKLLLSHPRIDPNIGDRGQQSNEHFEPLLTASRRGHTDVVRHLLEDHRTDPSIYSNRAIYLACTNEHVAIVRMLLSDESIDPNDPADEIPDIYLSGKLPLSVAAAKGNFEIVRLLLSDKRVDPFAKDNQAIILASSNGHSEIVGLILNVTVERIISKPSTNHTKNYNNAIIMASKHGYLKLAERLLRTIQEKG